MDGRGIRAAAGGADPAAEEACGALLRSAGAVLAVAGGGERGDEGARDKRGAGGRIPGDSAGTCGAGSWEGGAKGGECCATVVGGVREECVRGGPGAVREVRRGEWTGVEFVRRVAALIPPARKHVVRYYGEHLA